MNGKWLTRYSSRTRTNDIGEIVADATSIHATHPGYSPEVLRRLDAIDISQSPAKIINQVGSIVKDLAEIIDDDPNKIRVTYLLMP